MATLEEWCEIVAHALSVGLGTDDDPVPFEPWPIPKVENAPSGVLYPGGRNRRYITNQAEGSGFTLRHIEWTAVLLFGLPGERESYQRLNEWGDLIEPALRLCALDPGNEAGGYPVAEEMSAPLHVTYGGPEYLGATVFVSHSIYVE